MNCSQLAKLDDSEALWLFLFSWPRSLFILEMQLEHMKASEKVMLCIDFRK